MKRILIFLLLITLVACGSPSAIPTLCDPVPDQNMRDSEKGLSLTLNETIFLGSPAEINTKIYNGSPQIYSVGEFYHIEVKIDDYWYIVTYSDKVFYENPKFKDYGSTLYTDSEMRQTFSVDALGITLIPGEYRLVKTFLSQSELFHEISVATSFWVT